MMKTFLAALITVFLAELGDKTQLATLALAAREGRFWPVFLVAALALVLAAALGAAAGKFLGELLPLRYLRILSGGLFVLLGILILWGKI
ncbi:TMEM165/GDT1 family protein [Thermosulfurimonas marina]|nr:TMEM165/GDT1 family protein [Thermosulfurimonas marina]